MTTQFLNQLYEFVAYKVGLKPLPEFPESRERKIADKDSLRFHQAYFSQWNDDRQRSAQIANYVRDETGFREAVGYSYHPVNADFSKFPSADTSLVRPDELRFLNTPEFARTMRFTLRNDDADNGGVEKLR
jgi:hypothetical protein